jgi:prostaglandin-endoperoxide synthase 2
MRSFLFSEEAIEKWSVSYQEIAKQLLQDKLKAHSERPYNCIDVIRDLINLVPVYWIANYIVSLHHVRIRLFLTKPVR